MKSDWLLETEREQTVVGGVYVFLFIYFCNDDKKNIKKAVMSEDKLDDTQGKEG